MQELSNNYVKRGKNNLPYGIHIDMCNFYFSFVKIYNICNICNKLYKT